MDAGTPRVKWSITQIKPAPDKKCKAELADDLKADAITVEDQTMHTGSTTHLPVINRLEPADWYDYVLAVVRKNQAFDLPVLARSELPNVVLRPLQNEQRQAMTHPSLETDLISRLDFPTRRRSM